MIRIRSPRLTAVSRPFFTLMLLLAGVWGTFCLSGCQSKTSDRDIVMVDVTGAAEAARGERGLFGMRSAAVWVDVRSEAEYKKSRIPGAIHMPLETARDDHVLLSDYGTILVYGRDRNNPRAMAMSKLLLELGYKDVRTLLGGFESWRDAGRPVQEG